MITTLTRFRGARIGSVLVTATLLGGVSSSVVKLYAKAAGGNASAASTWSMVSSSGVDSSGPPTTSTDCYIDAGSGAVVIDANISCRSLDCTGYSGTLTHNSGCALAIGSVVAGFGDIALKFSAAMVYSPASSTSLVSLAGSVGSTQSVDTAGKALSSLTINGSGSWQLMSTLVVTNFLIISNGVLTTNSFDVTCSGFSASGGVSNLGTSHVLLTRTTTGNVVTVSGAATINAGSSVFVVLNASSNLRTFAGGGKTYSSLLYTVAGSTGGLAITGANVFDNISFSDVSVGRTLTLPAGSTTVVNNLFAVNGTPGKLMSVISSTSGTAAILSKGSGVVSCDYLSLKDSAAVGGASFYAGANSVNVSGNSGWVFTAPPVVIGANFQLVHRGRKYGALSGLYAAQYLPSAGVASSGGGGGTGRKTFLPLLGVG